MTLAVLLMFLFLWDVSKHFVFRVKQWEIGQLGL
jgi:hypothetical protein